MFGGLEKYLATPRIDSIEYSVMGDVETTTDSCVEVTHKETFKGDQPDPFGIYDPHMGTTDIKWNCHTCGNKKNVCPGHSGHLQTNYPLKNPLFRDEILKWLKIICVKCGRLLTTTTLTGPQSKIMSEYIKLCNHKKVKQCPWPDCRAVRFPIVKDRDRPFVFNVETKSADNKIIQHEIYNHEIRVIFNKITDETVAKVAVDVKMHPRNLIISAVRIPPNTIRPDIRRIGGASSRSTNNDITQFVRNLVDINEQLPKVIPEKDQFDKSLKANYNLLELTLSEEVRGSTNASAVRLSTNTNKTPTSLAERLKGKGGIVRASLMGKRVFNAARSVITGDNYLQVDEVGIPLASAKILQIPVIVNATNQKEMMLYFKNGKSIYPGCTAIKKKGSDNMYSIEFFDKNYVLQEGDVVYRDLIDGDSVLMNRPPSLLFSNISGHRVKIMEKGLTFRINVSACKCYNADFDGDAMTLLTAHNIQSRTEIERMSWIGNWFISYKNHAPFFGAYMDALLGASLITQSNVRINKWHGMNILGHINPVGRNYQFSGSQKAPFTGRDIVSMFLPEFNYPEKKATFYKSQYESFIKYEPEEIKVRISRGKVESGILDASTIGQGKIGSIFQAIKSVLGAKEALLCIYNFHQSMSRYLIHRGVTTGIRDTFISDETLIKIKESIASNLGNAMDSIEQLNQRKLVAPYGRSMTDFFEEQQMKILEAGDDFIKHIFQELDLKKNILAWMVFTGSRGKISNFVAINAAIGSQTIGGRRMTRNFGNGRTSPYFLRHDLDPRSLGYVENSFREGIDPSVFPFSVAESRAGSINNQLSTPVSGAQNRQNVKNMETMILSNHLMAAKKNKIAQILYADSGFDPRKTELVKFISVDETNANFEKNYRSDISMFDKKFQNPQVKKILEEEFEVLAQDRQWYRDVFMKIENNNQGLALFSKEMQMPVNPYFIIESTMQDYKDAMDDFKKEDQVLDPVFCVAQVRQLCDRLGYIFLNSIQEQAQSAIPEYMNTSLEIVKVAIRMYMCTANLARKKVNNAILRIILDKIRMTLQNALMQPGTPIGIIAAQCLSEPLTQYSLDSKHRSGGAGGSSTSTADRVKEILGARSTKSMKNPCMTIMVREQYEQDKNMVQNIANHIEVMELRRFVVVSQIFYEEYGNPVHPKYKHEAQMIKDFDKRNAGIQRIDESKWCIRFELNKEELITNSMKLDTIVIRLRLKFPKSIIVNSPEKSEKIVIRVYLGYSMLKPNMGYDLTYIRHIMDKLLDTVIRGIKGILNCTVIKMARNKEQSDGSIKTEQIFAISTYGTNLEEVLENPFVDPYRTQTDSIKEYEEIFGIDATRNKIIMELAKVLKTEDVVRMHSSLFADEMTFSGTMTSILKSGLGVREKNNVSLRISYQAPNVVIRDAAVERLKERKIGGISGPLLFGQIPKLGTTYNDILINREFVEKYQTEMQTNVEDYL